MAIQELLKAVGKDFAKKFSKDREFEVAIGSEVQPVTGLIVDNPLLEYVLDRRFIPYGRCYLTYGKKSCSKTSFFLYLAKLVQQAGGDVIWIETEKAADLEYAKKQGVDLSRLILPKADTLQEALTIAEAFIKNLPKAYPDGDTPVLICLDSIAGAIPEYECQSDVVVGETKVGEHARLMSGFYRKIIHPLEREKAIFLALNQLKTKIGTMSFGGEDPEAMIGGDAPRFHSTYQLKVDRITDLLHKSPYGTADRKVGSRHQMTCKRNKLGREGNSQRIEYDLYIDGGPDFWGPLVRKLAKDFPALVSRKGGYYYWEAPDTYYDTGETRTEVNAQGQEETVRVMALLDPEKAYRERELGNVIQASTDAKELIRKYFEIPDLPPENVVKQVEADNKKKRKKHLSEEEDFPLVIEEL